MTIEPYTIGASGAVAGGFPALVNFAAMPVGVRVLCFTAGFESDASGTVGVAVTVGEAPARVIADMEGQRPIFHGVGGAVAGLSEGIHVRIFAGINTIRWWAWNLDVVAGPLFVSVAFDPTSTVLIQGMFGVVGFRRIKPDEDP